MEDDEQLSLAEKRRRNRERRGRKEFECKPEDQQSGEVQLLESGLISKEDPEKIYEIEEILGKGSHGVVYRAITRTDGTTVALKKLENIFQGENVKNCLQEIKIMSKINSEYCIEYYNSYLMDDCLWIAMEFFDAGSIGDLVLAKNKGLTEAQTRAIIFQVLHGLTYLHSQNLIHRDVKAGNILLSKTGKAKLADFGISAILEDTETLKQTQVGSPYWMSPELITGCGYSFKTDIWSLGITIIEICEVGHPFFDNHPLTAVFHIVSDDPPMLQGSQWGQDFIDFITVCLQKDPNSRPLAKDLLEHCWLNSIDYLQTGSSEAIFKVESKSPQDDEEKDESEEIEVAPRNKRLDVSDDVAGTTRELACEYLQVMRRAGSRAAVRCQDQVSVDREILLKVFLHDKSYRTILVQKGEPADSICERLISKIGHNLKGLEPSRLALYKCIDNNEKCLKPNECPFDIIELNPKNSITWLFKERPDSESFYRLLTLVSGIRQQTDVNDFDNWENKEEIIHEFEDILLHKNLSVVGPLCRLDGTQKTRQKNHSCYCEDFYISQLHG